MWICTQTSKSCPNSRVNEVEIVYFMFDTSACSSSSDTQAQICLLAEASFPFVSLSFYRNKHGCIKHSVCSLCAGLIRGWGFYGNCCQIVLWCFLHPVVLNATQSRSRRHGSLFLFACFFSHICMFPLIFLVLFWAEEVVQRTWSIGYIWIFCMNEGHREHSLISSNGHQFLPLSHKHTRMIINVSVCMVAQLISCHCCTRVKYFKMM